MLSNKFRKLKSSFSVVSTAVLFSILFSGCMAGHPQITNLRKTPFKVAVPSTKISFASASGTAVCPTANIKFVIGYNQTGPVLTGMSSNHIRPTSAGVIRED